MQSEPLFFDQLNPLITRLGREFFATTPQAPGVYLFRSAGGEILYVGKAKNLRHRLNSYKNARPHLVSRKVLRMIRLTHTIETRVCADETSALLTENRLLRTLRPPFNVVNTSPETYYFIIIRPGPGHAGQPGYADALFELTTDLGGGEAGGRRFGVFRGRGRTRDSFGALLRLLSVISTEGPTSSNRFYFAAPLVKYRPPSRYKLTLPSELLSPLYAFLHGRSRAFLDLIVERLLSNANLPKFLNRVVEVDLKQLEEFYELGPRRVRTLKERHGIRRRVIGQDEIDDLLAQLPRARA